MELYLKNIGKIGSAAININGITIIAGENNTGKSTVGRSLFSVFNSFYKIDKTIETEKRRSIWRSIDSAYHVITDRFTSWVESDEIASEVLLKKEVYVENKELLRIDLLNAILRYDEHFLKFSDHERLQLLVEEIIEVLKISDEEMLYNILSAKLDSEFAGQVCSFSGDDCSEIKLKIRDEDIEIRLKHNLVNYISNKLDLRTEVVYIDDPFVLDEKSSNAIRRRPSLHMDHREHLMRKIFSTNNNENIVHEILNNKKFDNIYSTINSVCKGEISQKSKNSALWGYRKDDKVLDFKNTSAGIKTFAIIKKLLLNGVLESNGTIILDEPEIHLHPEWQLLFAEIIVLLQKEFGMHILLTTHSPYFLNAIEVYSTKHGISDKCNYYLSDVKNDVATVINVNDNLERIYYKLAYPLQRLENEQYAND